MGVLNQVLKLNNTVCHKVRFWDLYFFSFISMTFQNCLKNSNLVMYADGTNMFIKEKNINTLHAHCPSPKLIN